ncbi:MAG: hypothetical protein HY390_02140, partial [Deltaproteobacteria bacterium]|nr:hypothetical protein [Deltaproteobacteria bacterium]
ITYPEFIRTGNIFGPKIGICDISDPMARIEVRSDTDLKLAELILKGHR